MWSNRARFASQLKRREYNALLSCVYQGVFSHYVSFELALAEATASVAITCVTGLLKYCFVSLQGVSV